MALRNWYHSLFGKRPSKDRSQSTSVRNRRTSLRLEPLEERRLLAVDLEVMKWGPDFAQVGDTFEYTVTVTNATEPDPDLGGDAEVANNVVLRDVLPAGLTLKAIEDEVGNPIGTYDPGTRTCTVGLGSLEGGYMAAVVIRVTVAEGAAGTITNLASVTASNLNDNDGTPDGYIWSDPKDVAIIAGLCDLEVMGYGPLSLYPGEDLVWTYTVTNLADGAAADPVAAEGISLNITIDPVLGHPDHVTIPAGYTYEYSTNESGDEFFVLTANEGVSLAVGANFTVRFVFNDVTASEGYSAASDATAVIYGDADENNNVGSTGTLIGGTDSKAYLTAEKLGPAGVTAGEEFSYTITINNLGPGNGEAISVTDAVPVGASFVSATVPAGYTASEVGGVVTISMNTGGSLAAGDSVTFTLTFQANSNDAEGSYINNTAELTWSDATEPSGLIADPILVDTEADLSVEKVAVDAGGHEIHAIPVGFVGSYDYEVTFTNIGPSDATGVVIVDTLPAAVTLGTIATYAGWDIDVVGNVVTFTATSSVVVGYEVTFVLPVSVDTTGLEGQTLTNGVAITATGTDDPVAANNSDSWGVFVTPPSDLTVSKRALAAVGGAEITEVTAGTAMAYEITLKNQGGEAATDVTLTDTLPTGVSVSGAIVVPTGWSVAQAGNVLTFTPDSGTVAPDAEFVFVVPVSVASDVSGLSITNTAEADSTNDTIPGNDVAELATNVNFMSDLRVTKTVDKLSANPGETLTYTVTVTNVGPSVARNVDVDDALSSHLSYVSGSLTQISGPATFTLTDEDALDGVLLVGESATFTLQAVIAGIGDGVVGEEDVTNTVTVTSDSEDANGATAVASTNVTVADLHVVKTAPATAVAGETMEYTITITNEGLSAAQNVTLSDVLPAGVSFVSQSQTSGPAFTLSSSGNVNNTIASLAAGASASFTVVVQVDAAVAKDSVIDNTASATTSTTDSDSSDDESTASTTVDTESNLSVTKTVDKLSANPGETLTYTITVTNAGPSVATNVLVDETLSSNVTLVNFAQTTGTGFTIVPGEIDASGGTLAVGQTAVFTLVVTVNGDANGEDDATNNVTVSSDCADPVGTNNSASASTNVTVADLSLAKTTLSNLGVGPIDTVVAGEQMIYRITLTNSGPDAAKNVVITDKLPAGLSLAPGTPTTIAGFHVGVVGQTVTLTALSDVASGAVQIDLPVLVASSATGTIAGNTASVTSTTSDPDSDDLEASTGVLAVTTSADVTVAKVAATSVIAGQDLVYTITVTNNGPSDATGVSLLDVLPASYVTLVSATPASGFAANTSVAGQVTFTANSGTTVAAGASVTFTIRVSTDANLQEDHILTNNVTVQGTNDSTPNNNTATAVVTLVGGRADVSVTKSAVTTVIAGQTITYTFTVRNGGPTEARNVVLSDVLPAGLTYVSATAAGYTVSAPPLGSNGTVTLTRTSALAAGASDTVTIIVATSANAAKGSTITNTVTVSSTTNDPVAANNSASAATKVTDLGVGLSTSPLDPTKTDLVIGGGAGADAMYVYKSATGVMVIVNGKLYGNYSPNGRIVMYGRGGNDVLYVASTITTPAWMFGGDGNDVMYGGAGNDVLLGGAGIDFLWGMKGRNLLIGGVGTDTLYGTTGENIMIGGTTAHDANDIALNALMKEWTRTDLAQNRRIYHLRGDSPSVYGTGLNAPYFLNASSVFDDAARDLLAGGSRLNWYFQSLKGSSSKWDLLSGRWPTETLNYLY